MPEKSPVKRITRTRKLTPEEAARDRDIRAKVMQEFPPAATLQPAEFGDVVERLKAEREVQGVSIAELSRRTGIAAASLSRLENGEEPNPTVRTLRRYADAVGKRLLVTLAPEAEITE